MVLSRNMKKMQAHCSYLKFCPVELELSFDQLLTQAVLLPQWSPPLPEHLKYCMGPPPLPPSTDPLQPSGWRTFHVPPPPCTLLLHPSFYFHSYWGSFATFLLALSGVECFWEVIFFFYSLCLEEPHKDLGKQTTLLSEPAALNWKCRLFKRFNYIWF